MPHDDNPVLAAIRGRRSIRRFTDDPVERDDLLTILDAGRWAPSGLNNQPWRFLAVTRDDPRHEKLALCTKYDHIVRRSAVCVAVLLERDAMYSEMKDHQGAGACVQNMLLAAHAIGLGGVWLGQIINDQAASLDALGLNADAYELQAVVALGRPDQQGASERKPLDHLMLETL